MIGSRVFHLMHNVAEAVVDFVFDVIIGMFL
jgi:hypothetical protein